MNKILEEDALQIIEDNNGLKEIWNSNFMITGSSGMVGSYFLNTLLVLNSNFNANIEIYLLDRNANNIPEYVLNNSHVHIITQDITDPINCDEKIDYIVHAASPASPLIMKKYPVETNFANTIGTANTLKFAHKNNSKGYLFISSREIYGEPDEEQEFFYENGRYGQINHLVPRNGYSEGKKAAENMCACFREEYDLNTKIVRLAHTYGPGMSIYDGRVQADFLKNVIYDEDIVLKSDGSSIRTYTYISDAVNAMFKVLLYSEDFVYNIADENSKTSIKDLAELMALISTNNNTKVVYEIPNDNKNTGVASFTKGILSTDKIRTELNWKPKYSLKEGFSRTLNYISSELENDVIYRNRKN